MNWTKETPTEPGYYWYRTSPTTGVVLYVFRYNNPQQGMDNQLVAEPQLPYKWRSRPGFFLFPPASLGGGEWCPV